MVLISIGIDSGSTATKVAIFDGNSFEYSIRPTGWSPKNTIERIIDEVSVRQKYVVVTGYGRVATEKSDKKVTEITCHAKGAKFINNNVNTIIDIGGQDSKVIAVDNQGSVVDFLMNDKCAAGTGKFLEMTCNLLSKDINNLDDFAVSLNPANINSMCAVFAESEIISLLASGSKPEDIATGVINSIVKRTVTLLGRLGVKGDIFFSGGLSQSLVIKKAIEESLSMKVFTSSNSIYTGAIGAALIGYNNILK
jgi:predicted CoA-substrate-specific enzyme activase